jgi:glutamate dehydrogenase
VDGQDESPWVEHLAAVLRARHPGAGPDEQALADFVARAPASYRDQTSPAEAARDMAELAMLFAAGAAAVAAGDPATTGPMAVFGSRHRLAVRPSADQACTFRLRRLGEQGIELTRTLPVLESFGLVVVEAIPLRLGPGADGTPPVYIDDIGVRLDSPHGPEALRFVPEINGPRLVEALEAIGQGDADVDSLNRLVTVAGMDWRQVSVFRAYLRYWLQSAPPLTFGELADPLARYPDVARALMGYFQARFDPAGADQLDDEEWRAKRDRVLCLAELDLVPQLQQDHILRGYLGLIDATMRTNYFQRRSDGRFPPALTMKFDSEAVPELPAPRPRVETFVHSPRVEGIHLRAGLVARGGLRWSERLNDFRTEILDLAFAQVRKNAIIVPTGAKGGFVCRQDRTPSAPVVQAAYEEFVRSLLDITDNIVGGKDVAPPSVVAFDGTDPYLVVAADKGTATYSDLANSISEEMGFWLGDAFASGGSRGYDHKAMGITARGAWVAVRRHFRELDIDVQSEPIDVAGIGDMSGDVFGNGMLRSRAIRLVAAFDHRHVFLDPDPDLDAAFDERARLFALPGSSWAHYNPGLISPGGGVWSRQSKTIPLSPAVRARLGVDSGELSPPELLSAILAAPVDLLWFGGIGTYIKAPGEADADVGDHANNVVRVTADRVRARVIAEGANLAVTQQARIRYSRRGGRINADFIDNAAGVATSDREVNLKILLSLAIDDGRLAPEDRDGYLKRAQDEVATEVLRQVDHSVAALNRAAANSAEFLDAYEALLVRLESAHRFDRAVEFLPSSEEMDVRHAAGAGLIRPELAVILAYAKSDLVSAMEESDLTSDENLRDAVEPYFPIEVRQAFGDLIPLHRLYPQLVATNVAGEIVDQLGIVWAHETAAELGRPVGEVGAAFWAARQLTGAGKKWAALEGIADGISAEAESALHALVGEAVADLARCYLTQPGPFHIGAVLQRDRGMAEKLGDSPAARLASSPYVASLQPLRLDPHLVEQFAAARSRAMVGPVGAVVRATGRDCDQVLVALAEVAAVAKLDSLASLVRGTLTAVPPPERLRGWEARALADDVGAWERAAAIAALRAYPDRPPAEAVAAWAETWAPTFAAASELQDAPRHDDTDPLALAELILRRLRGALAGAR